MENPSIQLGDFQILQSIGQGSFSKVKLVRRISDNKLIALKQVSMDKLGMSQKNSALNQIRLLASIKSPYVISYEGSFYSSATNSLCLLMQYADNGDLETIINKAAKKNKMSKGLPEYFIWRAILHILQGLNILHTNKIVHRDIKPANIFYSKGIAKIGDLNVSAVSDSSLYSTKTGTPYYTAPEIWKGQSYTNNCDIWSLGCIIYEMCALLPPFKAQSFPQLFIAVTRGEYLPLSKQYSDDLRTFIRMCLVVDPNERPSALELIDSPVFTRKLNQMKDDLDLSGKVELLKPIKCPKVLRFLNSMLPQCSVDQNEDKQDDTSIQGSQTNVYRKKGSTCQNKKNLSRKKMPSIAKNQQIQTQSQNNSKTAIRIRSYNRLKTIVEPKSVKLIKQTNFTQKQQQQCVNHIKQLKVQPTVMQSKSIKTQKFRLRSCKRIGEKQNSIIY